MENAAILTQNYDDFYRSFSWQVPEHYNFAFDVVDRWAADRTKLALVSVSEDGSSARYHTFYELSRLSDRFANLLQGLGIRRGDRVLIILQSIPEWYVAMLGMGKLGVVPMPGTVLLTTKDIAYRINRAEARMVITDRDHLTRVEEAAGDCPGLEVKLLIDGEAPGWRSYAAAMAAAAPDLDRAALPPTRSDDPFLLYFTSGTTGQPKMVLHTHAYPLGHEVTARYAQCLEPTDLHWTVSETGWAKAAWGKFFGQMLVGAAILQRHAPGRFNPHNTLAILERYGVTTFCAPPTVYRMLIQEDLTRYKLTLRHSLSAGEPMNPEVIKVWKAGTGLDIYDFYGQTETVALLANHPSLPLKYGAMGKPTPGHDVRIVDLNGQESPVGEEGHIALYLGGGQRPPGLMKEYWKDEVAMAASFRGDCYYTGDRAWRDEDGYFWFVGRDDDIIKSSGYRIGPFEVESALLEHPAVAECAVVGAPDPEGVRGLVVKAFLVLAAGYTPSDELTREIQTYVKNTTAPYKYPRIVEYRPELPKTISGKILRRELRRS
ncbi:MAG: AMP-binding protein [Deltaproteobacteria bacterium]|nr:AMP-binding protein [Deltaproteobacteria bacterium]